jgi:uncharacterized membrane protein
VEAVILEVFRGRKPDTPPARTSDFDELEKKFIDVLVDAIKYIATTCGIVIAIYAQVLQGYLKSSALSSRAVGQFLLFLPLLIWFLVIVCTVLGIYPRQYRAITDIEKQQAIEHIRQTKRFWLVAALFLFVSGFAVFVYLISASLWHIYPFSLTDK